MTYKLIAKNQVAKPNMTATNVTTSNRKFLVVFIPLIIAKPSANKPEKNASPIREFDTPNTDESS